jgi:hypothetical protein
MAQTVLEVGISVSQTFGLFDSSYIPGDLSYLSHVSDGQLGTFHPGTFPILA